ncbi:MAG TPA: hypothetical protein VMF90_15935 [Rhizobiaceae bacterium]|nr:hypothetical protein [Rhizobiaceae bacterium]
MARKSFIRDVLGTIQSAISVSSAVESGRTPKAHHLKRLGIDPQQFGTIRKY